jgi:segregation and condensation protein B
MQQVEISEIIPHIEALIFASEKPLTSLEITELINNAFGFMDDKIVLDQIEAAVEGIIEKYRSEFYPFEIRESGGGWQFLTKKDYHKTVAQLNGEKYLKRLSSAALETLAIVAYKQPVTKGEIEAIRGVSSDYAVQKLLEKELILITGRNENLPGKPLIYATSKTFMDYFGLNTADDLPKIKEVLADQIVVPTNVVDEELQPDTASSEEEVAEDQEAVALIVSEEGELIEQEETGDEQEQEEQHPDTDPDQE